MERRDFVRVAALGALAPWLLNGCSTNREHGRAGARRTYATLANAMASPRETLAYVPAIYTGTSVDKPDYLATVDVDPTSSSYGRVLHRMSMPTPGDELHHFGWNMCSSCHGEAGRTRTHLVIPGLASNRIYIVDVATDPAAPRIIKTVPSDEIKSRTGLSTPHTVHCLPNGQVMISMLGDADGNAPGGFMLLDENYDVLGKWEQSARGMNFNYDFWYQPRHNVMVSSEWAAPNTVAQGFKLEDVQAGKYGQHLHFWDWSERRIVQSVNLGKTGMIPLEVRFHHDPTSTHGFVGAALSSSMWHFHKAGDSWKAENVIQVDPVEVDGWPFPVPGLITDLVLSLDDRYLYFSNWLHGDLRQYDVSDPAKPRLTGRVWLGGVLGKTARKTVRGTPLHGGPQMLQLSLDGRRLYVTNSLYSVWDNQFYPDIAKRGSYLLQLDCKPGGGLELNEDFCVDFGREPDGPARAHEIRFPDGDSTSDIWV